MSTKIYNAWRLPIDTDIFAEVSALREPVTEAQLSEDVREIVECATKIVDDFSLHGDRDLLAETEDGGRADPARPWSSAVDVLRHTESVMSQAVVGTNRQRFEIQFMQDDRDGRIYALHYADNQAVIEAAESVMAERGWADWHYQDQTDKDEDVSDEEWAQRKDVWDHVLGFWAPADVGVGAIIKPEGKFGTTPDVIPMFDSGRRAIDRAQTPSRELRLKALVKKSYLSGINLRAHDSPFSALDQWDQTWENLGKSQRFEELLSRMEAVEVADFRQYRKYPLISHALTKEMIAEAITEFTPR